MVSRIIKARTAIGPKGESASQANLNYWSDRASANSYHGPSSKEAGDSYLKGKQDKNGEGSNFMPGVRREG